MKVVIDISDEKYSVIKSELYNTFPAELKEWGLEAIRKGTPLQEADKPESEEVEMTRFIGFTDEELDAMESSFCNEGLVHLVDEIRKERE